MTKKKRKQRSQNELVQASKLLSYEFQMFNVCARALASRIGNGSSLDNALLESFLIHARNLIDFLYSIGQQDDVLADDFFTDSKTNWKKVRAKMSTLLKDTKKEAGYRLAHISYKRLNSKKSWRFENIHNELSTIFVSFLNQVTESKLDSSLKT